jgi:methionyl-tRNA formyltransferase
MRVGFFGTPGLAARCLSELHRKHEICFAVTAVDTESGRNRKVQWCPAKIEALRLNIPVLQPAGLKEPGFYAAIETYHADIFVIVAYGNLIPRLVYELPPLKTINLHPSLLPRYRGAAPIQWALINGEKETGITVQLINERLDAGDIIEQEVIPLDTDTTAADLYHIVETMGPGLLHRAIEALSAQRAVPIQQDESRATFCGKIDREVARIDWKGSSSAVHNLVRGLNPKPVAFSSFRGEGIRIWKTALMDAELSDRLEPGALMRYQKKRLLAGTGTGYIEIRTIQPANKKIMDGLSFINGYRLAAGERFE